jgi:anti-sigma factor RsiW
MTHLDNDHLELDQLGDYLDGMLSPDQRRGVEAHLAICSACSERRHRLESLIGAARTLAEEVEPPVELWSGIRTQVQSRATRTRQLWLLAAAAVVLVAVSSAVTALIVRRPVIVVRPSAAPQVTVVVPLPPAVRAVDADYAGAIRALNETLAENRSQLDPATVAKVEASLRVIDHAIGEARQALAADPSNLTLLDLLASNYERKVELLRRANALLPRT